MNGGIEFNTKKPPETEDRLHVFVKSFVDEIEATLTTDYKIMFGELKKVGTLGKVLEQILGAGAKYLGVGGVESLLKNAVEKGFEEYYKSKCYKYFDVIYNFNNEKDKGRRFFVKIGVDVFRSFEFQFAKITGERTYHEDMKNLATDAAHRFLNFTKDDEEHKLEARNVVFGKSKEGILNKLKVKSPGFKVFHGSEIWNTASLYEKSGVVVKNGDENKLYAREHSKHDKYSFRKPFDDENWKQDYKNLIHDVDFKFDYTSDIFFMEQCETIREIISVQDGSFVQQRSLELIREFSTLLSDGLESVTKEMRREYEEVIKILHEDIESQIEDVNRSIKDAKKEIIEKIENMSAPEKKKIRFGLLELVKFYTGRQPQLESIHKALTESKESAISQIAAIIGLGGTGKSQLAVKYAVDYSVYYDSIIFINSEKKGNIETSFKSLAIELGIPISDKTYQVEQKEKNLMNVVQKVYKYFEGTKLLIILDNVESYSSIKDFIFSYSCRNKTISTLITSRDQDCIAGDKGVIELIPLDIFTEDEAKDFAKNYLNNEKEEDVKRLIKALDSLPLAMKQALRYIEEENKNNNLRGLEKFTVKKYLELYEKENYLLLDKAHHLTDDVYNKTVATTWAITIKMIEENIHCGPLALKIFHIMSYVSPENIHVKEMFSDLVEKEEKIWEAVEILHKYSMIHLNKGIVHIHRLVQRVTQNHVKNIINGEEDVLRQALELLNGSDFEDHAVSVWEHSSRYSKLIDDFYSISEYGRWKCDPLNLLAAYRNDCKAIESLFKSSNEDIRRTFIYLIYDHPFCTAARHGNINVVKLFFEKLRQNSSNIDILTEPLRLAAINGHAEVVKYLHKQILSLDSKNYIDNGTLNDISINGHKNIIEILKPSGSELHLFYASFMSALLRGNHDDCKSMIDNVIEHNPNMLHYKFGCQLNSILHIAAEKGNIEIVNVLLKHIDVNVCNNENKTPIHFAASVGNDEMLIYLLEKGANIKAVGSNGTSLLHFAAFACKVDTLKMLIEKGLNCNKPDDFGDYPVNLTIFKKNVGALKFFIEDGMKFDSLENKTVLLNDLITSSDLRKEAIEPLVELGANVNALDKYGLTALFWASKMNKCHVVKALLKAGADPNIFNAENAKIALHGAVSRNNLKVAKLLLKTGAEPNILDEGGNNALHVAVVHGGKLPVVELLVRFGCDILAVNKDGKSPVDCAVLNKKEKIADFLCKKQMNNH